MFMRPSNIDILLIGSTVRSERGGKFHPVRHLPARPLGLCKRNCSASPAIFYVGRALCCAADLVICGDFNSKEQTELHWAA